MAHAREPSPKWQRSIEERLVAAASTHAEVVLLRHRVEELEDLVYEMREVLQKQSQRIDELEKEHPSPAQVDGFSRR